MNYGNIDGPEESKENRNLEIINDETNNQAAIEDNKAQYMLYIKSIIEQEFTENGLIEIKG